MSNPAPDAEPTPAPEPNPEKDAEPVESPAPPREDPAIYTP